MFSSYTFSVLWKRKVSFGEKIASFLRVLRLKTFFFLFPGSKAVVPFYRNSFLILQRGFNNAIGNYYAGMLEPDDMLFLTSVLRPGDLFFDVGSNIGSYTVLASKVCGARTIAFEPVPSTFQMLRMNIAVNAIDELVTIHNAGVGAQPGVLWFTLNQGGKNYVVTDPSSYSGPVKELPIVTLDATAPDTPFAMKIDVEGFELEVLKGAVNVLSDERLKVILIEINGLESRYQVSGRNVHEFLLSYGFTPFAYKSDSGSLQPVDGPLRHNTLYIRDAAAVRERLGSPTNT